MTFILLIGWVLNGGLFHLPTIVYVVAGILVGIDLMYRLIRETFFRD